MGKLHFLSGFCKMTNIVKRNCSSGKANLKICIVGSGPAGFYGAQQLTKVSLKKTR